MTFGQVLAVLRARWWALLLVLLLTVGTTLAVSLYMPKRYTATASVVVDAKPDPISAMIYPGMASPAFMATQVDVIQSDRVAYRVVKNLKLAESAQVRAQWQQEGEGKGTVEGWLVETFRKGMDVRPSRESNVISIAYTGQDPRFAAALANAYVDAYTQTALELRVDPAKQYNTFFDTRVKEARDALERAQVRLSQFQQEKGITVNDERLDVESARLNELSSQLVALQAISAESASRQQQAQGASSDRLQEVLNHPVVAGLRSDLSRFEGKLKELSSKLGDNHPQVQEAQANIAELRIRIDAESKRIAGGVTVSNTINRQREAQVRVELDSQRAKVLRIKSMRDESSLLQRDVENSQRTYDAVLARLNQTNLESQTTQSNINMLSAAIAPTEHSSPKIYLNVGLAFFVGLLLAIGTVMLLEMMDRRVRAGTDITAALGVPIIGVLPRPGTRRSQRGKALAMQARLVAKLAGPKRA